MRTRSAQLSRAAFQLIILSSALFAGCGGDAPVDMDDAGVTVCTAHTQCDDGLFCNGAEQCVPDSAEAGADGCVTAAAPCIANVTCDEAADACGTACTEGDMDGDGHDAVACGGDDCDDADADRFPGNAETCDDGASGQHDEDCDPETFGTTDRDGDGEVASSCCNMGTSGAHCGTDCDDTTIRRRSGQVEFCDAADNDCDGRTDEQTQDVPWYPDGDGDGFGGNGTPTVSCTPVSGHSLASTDCDDTTAQEHPAQLDICDLTDNNCNTDVDELPICDAVQLVGAAGGTLSITATGGGTITVQIPAGALSVTTPIALGEIHPRTLPPLATGQSFVGRPVIISPATQSFAVPANVSLPAAGPNLVVLRLDDEDDATWEVVDATFVSGQALFQAEGGGVYAVASKTCTATAETCDGNDNDCDWLVDEEDVCGSGDNLAERVEGWWTFCDQFDVTPPSLQLIESGCAASTADVLRWITASGETGYFFEGQCTGEGRWLATTASTLLVQECNGAANEGSEPGVVSFAGLLDRYMVVALGSGSNTEYEVYERLEATPPASCEGAPYDIDECGPVIGAPCVEDWYVESGACVACPFGSVNAAGDDPAGADTSCDACGAVGELCCAGDVCDGVAQCDQGGICRAWVAPTCTDAGTPTWYRLSTFHIPTPEEAAMGEEVGHNIDDAGTICGVPDYAGGVDNAFIDLSAALPALDPDEPLVLQDEIDAALACPMTGSGCTRMDLLVSVSSGTSCAIVTVEDGEGVVLAGPFAATRDVSGNLHGRPATFDFAIPLHGDAGTADMSFALTNVIFTGTLAGGGLEDVVIGGVQPDAAFENMIMQILPLLGTGIMYDDIGPILENLYDVRVGGTCSGLSVGLTATGVPHTPGP